VLSEISQLVGTSFSLFARLVGFYQVLALFCSGSLWFGVIGDLAAGRELKFLPLRQIGQFYQLLALLSSALRSSEDLAAGPELSRLWSFSRSPSWSGAHSPPLEPSETRAAARKDGEEGGNLPERHDVVLGSLSNRFTPIGALYLKIFGSRFLARDGEELRKLDKVSAMYGSLEAHAKSCTRIGYTKH
jgi:hypothetical protein